MTGRDFGAAGGASHPSARSSPTSWGSRWGHRHPLLPQADAAGIKNPKREALTVVGLLEIGGQLDGLLGFMHLTDAQAITGMGSAVRVQPQGERRAQGPVHYGGGGPEISALRLYR